VYPKAPPKNGLMILKVNKLNHKGKTASQTIVCQFSGRKQDLL
jgi:hypothetical protein